MKGTRLFRAFRPGDRKRYFRDKGLKCGPGLPEIDPMTLRRQAIDRMVELLGFGTGKIRGRYNIIEYPHGMAEQAYTKIRSLWFAQTIGICNTASHAPWLAVGWAKVIVGRVGIEIYEASEERAPGEVRANPMDGGIQQPGGIVPPG